MSIFGVKKYDGAYLNSAYVPRRMKFIGLIDQSEEKTKSISSKHSSFKF